MVKDFTTYHKTQNDTITISLDIEGGTSNVSVSAAILFFSSLFASSCLETTSLQLIFRLLTLLDIGTTEDFTTLTSVMPSTV